VAHGTAVSRVSIGTQAVRYEWPSRRLAVVGLGLIGTSVGLACKAGGRSYSVTGYDASEAHANVALRQGAIDTIALSAAQCVAEAEFVVIAVPILAVRGVLSEIAHVVPAEAVIMDTASTKQQVLEWAQDLLPESGRFHWWAPDGGQRF